jgi:hypothetical protein
MNDESIEKLLRGMRPEALPDDVCAALQETPVKYRSFAKQRVMAVAALLLLGTVLFWFNRPSSPVTAPVLTIRHQESTLLSSKRLELRQENEVWWEKCEQEWLDEDTALCSNNPAVVRYTGKRREVVWQPVDFQ